MTNEQQTEYDLIIQEKEKLRKDFLLKTEKFLSDINKLNRDLKRKIFMINCIIWSIKILNYLVWLVLFCFIFKMIYELIKLYF